MKYRFLILLAFVSIDLRGQVRNQTQQSNYGLIQFNTHFYDAVDHWVMLPKTQQLNKYIAGYVYMDPSAGFSMRVETAFDINGDGLVQPDSTFAKARMTSAFIMRLGKQFSLIYPMPDKLISDLHLPSTPQWLANYRVGLPDKNSAAYKVMIGRHLNSAGAPAKALEYLEPVYKTDPHAKGLEFELTYAYNELGQYGKAVDVLKAAIANAPNDPLMYRELGYAYMRANDFTDALKVYTDGLAIAKQYNKTEEVEMVQNMTTIYMQLNQLDKAEANINSAIADLPNSVALYSFLAVVYTRDDAVEKAIMAYTKVLDLAKDNLLKSQTAWNLALLYKNKKNDNEFYSIWGRKAKEWAPANSPLARTLSTMSF